MLLYDSLTRQKVELPPPPGPIRMYVCGPTVYQRIHIGNARPYIVFLWMKRWLEEQGYDVNLVENITKQRLAADQILPLHGRIVPVAELLKAAGHSH